MLKIDGEVLNSFDCDLDVDNRNEISEVIIEEIIVESFLELRKNRNFCIKKYFEYYVK